MDDIIMLAINGIVGFVIGYFLGRYDGRRSHKQEMTHDHR